MKTFDCFLSRPITKPAILYFCEHLFAGKIDTRLTGLANKIWSDNLSLTNNSWISFSERRGLCKTRLSVHTSFCHSRENGNLDPQWFALDSRFHGNDTKKEITARVLKTLFNFQWPYFLWKRNCRHSIVLKW